MTAILGILGVSVSVIIIAVGGGFSGPGPSILSPPTVSDLWTVGAKIKNGTTFRYFLTSITPHSSLINSTVSLKFANGDQGSWNVFIYIRNGTTAKQGIVMLSKNQLTNEGKISKQFLLYYQPLESSILAIRDIAREPKYLVVGAIWDKVVSDVSSFPVRITARENIKTESNTIDSFVLTYSSGSRENKIWLNRDISLPIKAEVYDSNSNLQYRYTLSGLSSA
jgi:hypothetical protein